MTEQEIDNLIKQREFAKKRLEKMDSWKKERQKKLEQFASSLDTIDSSDYDSLKKVGLLTQEHAHKLKEIDTQVQIIKKMEHPSDEFTQKIEQLTDYLGRANQEIREAIRQKQGQFTDRIEKLKNKLAEMYIKRSEELTALLKNIESQPRVMDRLKEIEEEQTQKKETEEREIQIKLLSELTRAAQSMRDRHTNAFKRLAEILNNPAVKDESLAALEQSKKSTTIKQSEDYFREIGDHLIKSVLTGENDKQIKSLKEITPRVMPGGIDYSEAKRNLENAANLAAISALAEKGNAQAKKLLEQREQLLQESAALDKILEQKNREGKNILLDKLQKRRENDTSGMTEKLKKAHQEQEKATQLTKTEQEKKKLEMEELAKKGGFYVTIPQQIFTEGQWHSTGRTNQGAVLLEKTMSKKGNAIWKITEVAGAAEHANILGKTSTLDMSGFPTWLKNAAKQKIEL